eukprot:Lithocolla_globosa_v1_NODE_9851_length_661_cov_1215.622112.p1 type:complete len:135 gc:universal NODE_9851_length_661_cov_1215.622112:557-153(-)
MNLALIENFRTETFYDQLSGTNSFEVDINCQFIPDEIILKNISAYDNDGTTADAAKDKMFLLKSSLITDNGSILASFPYATAYHESYHVPFKNVRPIGGTYTFTITDIEGNPPAGGGDYDTFLSVTLLFIKYRK